MDHVVASRAPPLSLFPSSPSPPSPPRYLEHRGTGKASQKRLAFNEKFDLVQNAFRLFGFSQQVSVSMETIDLFDTTNSC